MNKEEINKIKGFANYIRKINGKVILLSLLNKAKKEYDENNYADCRSTCQEIIKKDPQNAVALRGLGCVEQAEGNMKKAVSYYKKALKNSANKEIEYTLIGTIYYLEYDLENAIKYYNMAIDCNNDFDSAYEGKNQSMLERHLEIVDLQDSLIKRNIF